MLFLELPWFQPVFRKRKLENLAKLHSMGFAVTLRRSNWIFDRFINYSVSVLTTHRKISNTTTTMQKRCRWRSERKKNKIPLKRANPLINSIYLTLTSSHRNEKLSHNQQLADPSKNVIQFMTQESFEFIFVGRHRSEWIFFLWKIDVLLLAEFLYISHIREEYCLIFLFVLYDKRQSYQVLLHRYNRKWKRNFYNVSIYLLKIKQKTDFFSYLFSARYELNMKTQFEKLDPK